MRTVSNDVINNLGLVRTIGARVTIRDIRLRFAEDTEYTADARTTTGEPYAYDAVDYGAGVLRILVFEDGGTQQLWYQYITALQLDNSPWPAWTLFGAGVAVLGRPALFGNRLFYKRASDGQWLYSDFNSMSWSAGTTFYGTTGDAIAPVSATEVYILTETSGTVTRSEIRKFTIGSSSVIWPGLVYNPAAPADVATPRFDAVRLGSQDYIFFSDYAESRTMYMIFDQDTWSDVLPVVPIDIVDDNSKFILHGATVINNRIMLTGGLVRLNTADGGNTTMLVYLFGPGFSLGRDMFIGIEGAVGRNVTVGPDTYVANAVGGNLHVLGNKVWHLGYMAAHQAPATYLLGVDNAAKKLVLSDVANMSFGGGSNEPASLVFDVPAASYDANLIKPGSDVTLEVSYGGHYAEIGTFNIDGTPREQHGEGETYSVVARGQALKRLRQWQSDASYDYWSQTKAQSNPYDLTRVLRTSGTWKNTHWPIPLVGSPNVMVKGGLNDPGFLQLTAKACRGGFAKARFYAYNNALVNARRGVVMNFYRALQDGASGLTDGDFVSSGLVAVYGTTEHSGAEGVGLYKVVEDVWTLLTSWAYTIPLSLNKFHWLGMFFIEGAIEVLYLPDDNVSTDWISIGTYQYNDADDLPWRNEQQGRAGVFMENACDFSTGPAFSSSTAKVPVDDLTVFPATGDILVEDEWITYAGKSPLNVIPPQGLLHNQGVLYAGAPHANGAWTEPGNGYAIWLSTVGSSVGYSRSMYNDLVLVVESGSGVGSVFTVTDYDWSAPGQWIDTGGPYTYPEKWQDHIGDLAYGAWEGANRRRIYVQEDPAGVLGDDSILGVYTALTGCTRGVNGGNTGYPSYSLAVAHSAGNVNVWAGVRSVVDRASFFSSDIDYSVEDMIGEVAIKAGVLDYVPGRFFEGPLAFTQPGWDVTNLDDYPRQRKTMVVHWDHTSGLEVGFGYGFSASPHSLGRTVVMTSTEIRWYSWATGSPVLLEAFPISGISKSLITVSIYKNETVSVWFGRRLVASFHDEVPPVGDYCGFMANGNAEIDVVWPDLDRRVDNFILDMGFDGQSLVSQLVGEKRIFFQDHQYGGLKAFSTRETINASNTAYDLSVLAGRVASDLDVFTRIRVESAEYHEEIDPVEMADKGNLFALINLRQLDTLDESQAEAILLIAEALKKAKRVDLVGAFDPRVEPNDNIWTKLPSGVAPASPRAHHYIVEDVTVGVSLDDGEAALDMKLGGYEDPAVELVSL